ncbi:hypothetical protein HYQ45_016223 [Verticillium longisporum]|uniref:Uncharacterized protein n=1 Tax=Verticillium longisporum TaxID=100787 RepID=A0A8I2Z7A0_VERLO|nr:hypothetical protein HYQ45_016223 [Verticillium longisporum]
MEDTRTVEVDDYESIVADVQELLKATLDEKTPLQEPEKNTSWRKALAPGEFSRDVGRFRKLFAMASRLSINVVSPIIPSSSLVFQMVQNGSLGELKSLLASGQANVRSQDEDGHTLLHYAMRRRVTDPEVSRFLIDCGLDTNATPTKQKFA